MEIQITFSILAELFPNTKVKFIALEDRKIAVFSYWEGYFLLWMLGDQLNLFPFAALYLSQILVTLKTHISAIAR